MTTRDSVTRWRSENRDRVRAQGRRATAAYRSRNADKIRDLDLRTKYGITLAQYRLMLEAQGGRCGICGTTKPGGRGGKYFSVDHDHETGRVRGLLCRRCNVSLGAFRDDVSLLHMAIAYLQKG